MIKTNTWFTISFRLTVTPSVDDKWINFRLKFWHGAASLPLWLMENECIVVYFEHLTSLLIHIIKLRLKIYSERRCYYSWWWRTNVLQMVCHSVYSGRPASRFEIETFFLRDPHIFKHNILIGWKWCYGHMTLRHPYVMMMSF